MRAIRLEAHQSGEVAAMQIVDALTGEVMTGIKRATVIFEAGNLPSALLTHCESDRRHEDEMELVYIVAVAPAKEERLIAEE